MKRLVLTPEADAEALDAHGWYEREQAGLGDAFRDELDATIRRIRWSPLAHRVVHRDLRRALVRRFPYVVLYRLMGDSVVVVAIVHGRRAPARWRTR